MSENKLRIKTLPSETDPNIIIPVVSPKAVQGTFPKILEKDTTNVSLDEFLVDLKSYLEGLGTTISNVIDSKFNEKFPASEETGISWETTLQTQCNDLSARIQQIENTMLPVGMTIKSYDFEHYPDGSAINWEDDEFDLSDAPSGWELVETQEELVYLTSLVKYPTSEDSYRLFSVEEAKQFFLEKYKNIVDFTTAYSFVDSDQNRVKSETINFRVYGSVTNGDATPTSGNQAHFETLQQVGDSIYVTWDKSNDNSLSYRFNIELKTVRPCFVWRKVG